MIKMNLNKLKLHVSISNKIKKGILNTILVLVDRIGIIRVFQDWKEIYSLLFTHIELEAYSISDTFILPYEYLNFYS